MVVDKKILDELSAKAKANPRLRCNLDMRNSADDQSQRMLNALEPGTVMPIHRHKTTSETCICIRGHFEEYFYDSDGHLTDTIDMVPGEAVLNIEKGQWHSLRFWSQERYCLRRKTGLITHWKRMRYGTGERDPESRAGNAKIYLGLRDN